MFKNKKTKFTVDAVVQTKELKRRNEEILRSAAQTPICEILNQFDSSIEGLSQDTIDINRSTYGENVLAPTRKSSLPMRIAAAFINPFTAILFFLAMVSLITDVLIPIFNGAPQDADPITATIIFVMLCSSGTLRFVQESRSGSAAEKLLHMITTTCTVTRKDGGRQDIPLSEVVVGDILHLSAGDMLPADVRVIDAKDLFISQSALTGESDPQEKSAATVTTAIDYLPDCSNIGFMGSNVVSGSATAIVIATGSRSMFGTMAKALTAQAPQTSFTKGVNSVSWVLIRFMLIMVPIVFFLNGITKGDWLEAFLFGISIAVGLTPEMLPMIVTTCLAKGAVSMSKKKTIVKNLNSIQNFGAIDVLCTDKTGTITQDKIVLNHYIDVHGNENVRVLRHAYLNSYFQTGYKNLMDVAILDRAAQENSKSPIFVSLSRIYKKIDEIPFDFTRRRLSVVVEDESGKTQMVTKGAVEEMLSICTFAEYENKIEPLTETLRQEIRSTVDRLNDNGMRVVAIAQKNSPSPIGAFSVKDECNMVLIGYVSFIDSPKQSTASAIKSLKEYGVTTKVLTGDNDKVARYICNQVGLCVDDMLLGSDIANMSDDELSKAVEKTSVFAKLSPDQKAQVVRVLRSNGHVVGFMGDGINDAAAMKASDIGISVDAAVDIAKESADIILLEKDLMVLEQGIIEGRKTYANMIKYIKMTASSNFRNMFSVLAASALLPFLPMKSVHLIFLNLIYDLSCTAIPWDNVDVEFLKKPRTWDASSIGSFMLC
ncbi:MAG: magnesium-translocating P-type ATPase, partial [Oscillospiraceae bacterium]